MSEKIVILVNALNAGGAERIISYILDYLRDEYEIHLLLFEDEIEYPLPENQIVTALSKNDRNNSNLKNMLMIPSLSRKLVNYCRENEIRLVFSLLSRANFVSCFAKKLGLRQKVLISERVFVPSFYQNNTINGKIGNFLVSHLYPLADAILPNSKRTADALRDQYRIDSEYIVIKNMLDVEGIRTTSNEPVKNIDFGKFTFINVAGFRLQKNHKLLLEAFRELGNDNAQLLMIGTGKVRDEIERTITDFALNDKVFLLGPKENPFKYLQKSDCFVLSSDFEGFPNVLLEALACELPIVSTDCMTGPRELLAPGSDCKEGITENYEKVEYGILTPVGNKLILADAMNEMMENEQLRKQYKNKSLKRAMDFDVNRVIGEYKEIFDRFLASGV